MRLFAGHDLPADLHERADMAAGVDGVPQGGDLAARDAAPSLAVQALADPGAARLQRLQVIKGWVEDGQRHERVFDVACSDGLAVDPETHRCPDNGATVDLATCAFSEDLGASQLGATWTDPTWDGAPHVFYYARVLENPTCRWSTWDAIRAGVAPRAGLPETLQERAWTSPVWVPALVLRYGELRPLPEAPVGDDFTAKQPRVVVVPQGGMEVAHPLLIGERGRHARARDGLQGALGECGRHKPGERSSKPVTLDAPFPIGP